MKTEQELELIRSSKKFQNLIAKSNKYFRRKEKLQKEELKRFNKNLPLENITEEIKIAKDNMNIYLDKALKMFN